MKNKILLIAFVSFLVSSCVGEPQFSYVPEIGFNNIRIITTEKPGDLGTTKKDSVIITIDFKDGDGDLGFTDADYQALIKKTGDSVQTIDINIFVSKNGKFIKSNPKEKIGGNLKGGNEKDKDARFKKGSLSGPIEGTIDFSTKFEYKLFQGIPYLTGKSDTVKFTVQIMDRALNKSNIVETTPIVLYQK